MSDMQHTLDALLGGTLEIHHAGNAAWELTAGRQLEIAGRRTRARLPMREVMLGFEVLTAAIRQSKDSDPKKWAAMYLMTCALLGAGQTLKVLERVREVVRATGGQCPAEARAYALAMCDRIVEASGNEIEAHLPWLQEARALFANDEHGL